MQYRASDPSITFDDLYEVPIRRCSAPDDLEIDTSAPARYVVQEEGELPLDFLLYPRQGSRLLVGLHGAEMRASADLPKFQFVRSFLTRDEPLLFLSDSTLLQDPDLVLGWMFGSRDRWLVPRYAEIVKKVQDALGVPGSMLVGHSGGGFAAMALAAHIDGSRAVSVNGQTVLRDYEKWTLDKLRSTVTEGDLAAEDFFDEYADRLDIRQILAGRAPDSRFAYFGHAEDPNTMSRLPMFPRLAEHFGVPVETGGRTEHGDVLVACDWEMPANASPHALPGTVLPFIEFALESATSFPLHPRFPSGW